MALRFLRDGYFVGKVGIGINSPLYKLHVDGQVKIQTTNYEMLLLHQSDANGGFIRFTNTDDTTGWYTGIAGTEKFIISRTADNTVPIITLEQNGKVGIGTESPVTDLTVVQSGVMPTSGFSATQWVGAFVNTGAVDRIARVGIYSGNNSFSLLNFGDVDDADIGGISYSNIDNSMALRTNNGERLLISSAGAIKFNNYNAANNTGTPTYLLGTDASGNVVKVLGGGGTVTGTGVATRVAFWNGTSSLSADSNLYWDDTNNRLGIGTTGPGRKLTVAGDVSGDANNLLLSNENDTDGDSASIGFSMLSNNTYVKSGIFFKRTTTQGRGDLIFANNNEVNGNNVTLSDAKITIQPAGNVGIGTTNPSAKFVVADGMSGTNSQTGLEFIPQDSSNRNIIFSYDRSSGAYRELNLDASNFKFNPGGSTKMVIDTSGNVGIGTTSPIGLLEVRKAVVRTSLSSTSADELVIQNTDHTGITILAGTSHAAGIHFGDVDASNIGMINYFNNSNRLEFTTNGTANMFINRFGDVGIGDFGTAAAQKKLHVNSGTTNVVARFESTDTIAAIEFKDNNGSAEIGNTGNDIVFFPAGTEKMRIDSSGNVGINVTNPTEKLHVVGNIFCSLKFGNLVAGSSGVQFEAATTATQTCRFDSDEMRFFAGGGAGEVFTMLNSTGATTFTNTVTATNFILSSDERLKENIKTLEPKVISANWKSFNAKNDDSYRTGVIAQELEKKHPEFVETNDKGFKSVKYIDLLISKIAELEARLEKAGI